MGILFKNRQTPTEEIAEGAAKQMSGIQTAALAVALEDQARTLREYASRVKDTHELQLQLLGKKPSEPSPETQKVNDDMGITIQGDTQINFAPADLGKPAQPAAIQAGASDSMKGFVKKAAVAAALVGTGALAGLPATLIALSSRQAVPPAVAPQAPVSPPVLVQPPAGEATGSPNVVINGSEYELRLVPE